MQVRSRSKLKIIFLHFFACLLTLLYQKNIQVDSECSTLLLENELLEDSTLYKCIGLHTLGILNCDFDSIATHKTCGWLNKMTANTLKT